MTFVLAQWLVTIIAVIALVHVYWALGGEWAAVAAVPQVPVEGGARLRPAFKPRGWMTLAGGGGVAGHCPAGVPAGRLVAAAGGSLVVTVGDQRHCAVAVCPGHWRFGAGGVFQGGQGVAVCAAGYLGLLAVVCRAGGGIVGGGLGLNQAYPIYCGSWPAGDGVLTGDLLFDDRVHIHFCGNGHLWFRPLRGVRNY